MHEYVRWMIYGFLLYRSFCLVPPSMEFAGDGGMARGGEERERERERERENVSDPRQASWFAYSPLHNPVVVIHHASVARVLASRGDASAAVHPHGASIRVLSTRAALLGGWVQTYTYVEGVHYTCNRFRTDFLFLSCLLLTASEIFAERIHDPTIARANLHPWNSRRGQRQPPTIECGNLLLSFLFSSLDPFHRFCRGGYEFHVILQTVSQYRILKKYVDRNIYRVIIRI